VLATDKNQQQNNEQGMDLHFSPLGSHGAAPNHELQKSQADKSNDLFHIDPPVTRWHPSASRAVIWSE
jgi:hypothetical protein